MEQGIINLRNQIKENWIDKLDPFDMSNEDMKGCSLEMAKIYREDKPLYDKLSALVSRFNLGGLWRGHDAVCLILAKELKNKRVVNK